MQYRFHIVKPPLFQSNNHVNQVECAEVIPDSGNIIFVADGINRILHPK